MNLLTLLPLLKGWKYSTATLKNVTIVAGEIREFLKVVHSGCLSECIIHSNTPELSVTHEIYDSQGLRTEKTLSAKTLYELGLLSPNPTGWYCPRYDTVTNDFVIAYYPSLPEFFYNMSRILLTAPPATTTVKYASAKVVEIVDMEDFISSFRETLGLPVPTPVYIETKPRPIIPAVPVTAGGVTEE